MSGPERQIFRFGPFQLDTETGQLRKDGIALKVHGQPVQILQVLLERPGKLVTREELRGLLWATDTFVDFDHSLNSAIKKLRQALGDDPDAPRFIETVPKRGYCYIGQIAGEEPGVEAVVAEVVPRVSGVHRRRIAATILLGSAGLLLLSMFVVSRLVRKPPDTNASARAPEPSIAVLPFADLSAGHDHQYFSEGVAEEILNRLTKIAKVKVTARTSAFQFQGRNEDSSLIGKKLGVANLLEGSVQSSSNQVRVTVHLTRVADRSTVWSESYDRDLKDIFKVEDDIASAVAAAVLPRLAGQHTADTISSSQTTSPEALQAFLRARYLAHRNDSTSAQKALRSLDEAIRLDPTYAPAYAFRGTTTAEVAGEMGTTDLVAALAKCRRDAEKAITLDATLAAGYLALSRPQTMFDHDWQGAEQSVKRARELAPGDAEVLYQEGFLAMCRGQLSEAASLLSRAHELDPLSPGLLGYVLLNLGRYEEAQRVLQNWIEVSPDQVETHATLGEIYLAQGHPKEALAEMEKESLPAFQDFGKALAFHALGRHQESDAALSRLIAQHHDDAAWQIAKVYAYRGENDQAFHWLDLACSQYDFGVNRVKGDWTLKDLRNDPRYIEVLRKLNLLE